jgi:hypothetical protein
MQGQPPADPTNYYVSNDGNDNYGGHISTQPWSTLAKLQQQTFAEGDSIFLAMGSSWSEQLSIAYPEVVITSYGTGEKPIISGGESLTTWVENGDNIWRCKPTGTVTCLYSNGVRLTPAQLPNVDYGDTQSPGRYVMDSTSGSPYTMIACSELSDYGATLVGATLHIRPNEFTWERRIVTEHNTDTLRVSPAFTYSPDKNWRCFLTGLPGFADTTGEWALQSDDSLVLVSPVDPSTLGIVGIVQETGISIFADYVTVDGLEINYQDSAAVKLIGNRTGVVIKNNSINYQFREAVNAKSTTTDCHILNNKIRDCSQKGMYLAKANNDSVYGNTINYIGMYAGWCREYGGEQENMTAIQVESGSASDVIYNLIDSTGYCGIAVHGDNHLVYRNYIDRAMQKLSDGGAIYNYGTYPSLITHDQVWRANIVRNTGANWWDATPTTYTSGYAQSMSLYNDGYSNTTTSDSNTTINSAVEDYFNQYSSADNTVTNNTFYRCGATKSAYSVYYLIDPTKEQYGGLTFTGNKLFPRAGTTHTLLQQYHLSGGFIAPTSDNNVFALPYTTQTYTHRVYTGSGTSYTLAGWQTYSSVDAASTGIYDTYEDTTPLDSIFYNPTISDSSITLTGVWRNLDGTIESSPMTLTPFESKILIGDNGVRQDAVSSVLATTATGNGTVIADNVETSIYFKYSTTPGIYTDSTIAAESPLSGTAVESVTATITGLSKNETYYMVIGADNSNGYRISAEVSFTTDSLEGFVVFSYTGDGVDGKDISLAFTPDVVLIKSAEAGNAIIRTSTMLGDTTFRLTTNAGAFAGGIKSIDDHSIELGTDTAANKSGVTYYGMAWKAATGYCGVGDYFGIGIAKQISGLDSLRMIVVKGQSSTTAIMRMGTTGGDTSGSFGTNVRVADCITSIDDGFWIGASDYVNKDTRHYHYVWFDTLADYCWQDKYYGDGQATHAISSVTSAQPDAVFFNVADATNQRLMRLSVEADNKCLPFGGYIEISDATYVKTLDATGWTVGEHAAVNLTSKFIHWIAWKMW